MIAASTKDVGETFTITRCSVIYGTDTLKIEKKDIFL